MAMSTQFKFSLPSDSYSKGEEFGIDLNSFPIGFFFLFLLAARISEFAYLP